MLDRDENNGVFVKRGELDLPQGSNSITSMALSEDGTVLAVGDGSYNKGQGQVCSYKWDGDDWFLRGYCLAGDNGRDNLGTSLVLTGDGKILVVCATQTGTEDSGYGKLYD